MVDYPKNLVQYCQREGWIFPGRSRISKKEIPCVFTFKPHSTLCHFHSIENDFHLHTTYFLLSCFQTIKLDLLFTPHSSIYCKLSKDDDVVVVFIINYCLAVPHLVFLNTSQKNNH